MNDVILVLNAGSSSLKFSVFTAAGDALAPLMKGQIEAIDTSPRFVAKDAQGTEIGSKAWGEGAKLGHQGAIAHLVEFLRGHGGSNKLVAVGHRVVHGGPDFVRAVRIDPEVTAALAKLIPLAPLHQPHNLKPIEIVATLLPDLPQVACFDTAFHRTQPEVAQAFALPPSITGRAVRRYGFHGLSYEYIADVLPQTIRRQPPAAPSSRTSATAAACARWWQAAAWLPRWASARSTACRWEPAAAASIRAWCCTSWTSSAWTRARSRTCSTRSPDCSASPACRATCGRCSPATMRRRDSRSNCSRTALGRELGSLAAAAGGLDALVFTGGIGEHAAAIRERMCRDAAWVGVVLDPVANQSGGPRISTPDSKVPVWVIPTNEELMIARHTRELARATS